MELSVEVFGPAGASLMLLFLLYCFIALYVVLLFNLVMLTVMPLAQICNYLMGKFK